MSTNTRKKLTFEEYLSYDDGTDNRYELVDGELVELPPESDPNCDIARFLFLQFCQIVHFSRICMKDTEIEVRGGRARTRYPDLIILTEELKNALRGQNRSTITWDMPAPALVVEVVSPGAKNERRDYEFKRSEYAAREIPEYWIVDRVKQQVFHLLLVNGLYEETVISGHQKLVSSALPELTLTPAEIFASVDC